MHSYVIYDLRKNKSEIFQSHIHLHDFSLEHTQGQINIFFTR